MKKKAEFEDYIKNSNVIDEITEALICLYEEEKKVDNSSDYVKKHLKSDIDPDKMISSENKKLLEENKRLKKQIEELTKKVEELERNTDN